jgi:hypothetical protein
MFEVFGMNKTSALVNTGISDPAWGRPIRVSATAWNYYVEQLNLKDDNAARRFQNSVRQKNQQGISLRQIIAQNFADSAGRIMHYFKLGSKPEEGEEDTREWGEIRNVVLEFKGSTKYFISAVRPKSVDILVIQGTMLSPKEHKSAPGGI